MNKNLKTILILASALILCILAYISVVFVADTLIPEESEAEGTDTVGEIVVLKMDDTSFSALSYTYDNDGDGTPEVLSFSRKDEVWTWNEDPEFPISDSVFDILMGAPCYLVAKSKLEYVTDEKFDEYGLNAPTKTVRATDASGERVIHFGISNAYNDTHYAYIEGDKTTVYLISSDIFNYYEASVMELADLQILPKIKLENVLSVTVSSPEKTAVCTNYNEGKDGYYTDKFTWFLAIVGKEEFPISTQLSDTLSALVSDLEYLELMSCDRADRAKYGIDGKKTLTIKYKVVSNDDTEEIKELKLDLGNTDKYGYYYASLPDSDFIYLLGGSAYNKLFTLSYDELAPIQIAYVSVNNIDSISLDSEKLDLTVSVDKTGDSIEYNVDGAPIKYADFNSFITGICSIEAEYNSKIEGAPQKDTDNFGKTVLTVAFEFSEGTIGKASMTISVYGKDTYSVSFLDRDTQIITQEELDILMSVFDDVKKASVSE